jgi:hypothetical protein
MAWFLGMSVGSVVSAFILYAFASWVLKKAPAVTHGIGPGLGVALFMWGGWDDPTSLPPILKAGSYALGTALMYLLLGLLRKPRRARMPELALSYSLMFATLFSFGPAWAKSTYVASSAFHCASQVEPEIPAGLSPRVDYCNCVLAPVFAPYRPVLSDIWTRGGLLEFERQASAAMQGDPNEFTEQLERNDACSTKHFPPETSASMRKKGVESIVAQTVSNLARSEQLANVASPSAKEAYADCLVRIALNSCKANTPAAVYRCVKQDGELATPDQDAIASQCVPLLAKK